MRYYLLILGSLCILYYLILAFYSRRLRSTFAAFWLLCGGVHLVLGCAPLPVSVYAALGWICAVCWIIFLFVEAKIIRGMYAKGKEETDWVIVLGAQVRGTFITNSLKRRLDRAVSYLEQFPHAKVIVSGGQGPGESITEAAAMAGYLREKGISGARIFQEDRSTSTRENLRFSRKYADAQNDRVGIVTNDFHIYRASVIARQEGYRKICTIPAGSNPIFQMNYLMREFFAVLQVWLRSGVKKR